VVVVATVRFLPVWQRLVWAGFREVEPVTQMAQLPVAKMVVAVAVPAETVQMLRL
jgi:hypothetical protein